MKVFMTILAAAFMISVSAVADDVDLAEITEHYNLQEVEEYIELVEQELDAPLTAGDNDVEIFLELEVSEIFFDGDSERQRYDREHNLMSTENSHFHSPFKIAWKWGLRNFTLYSDQEARKFNLPRAQLDRPLASKSAEYDLYVAAAELTGAVANIDIYTEFGITGGNVDTLSATHASVEEIEDAIELDPAGYYVSGGASMGVGRWTIGVKAGYEQSDMTSNGRQAGVGETEASLLLGNATSGLQAITPQETSEMLTDDPFQLVYFQGSANRSVTEKLGVKIGALCFAVPEQFVMDFQEKDMSGYGFELFGDINYQIAKSITYSLYLDYALTDNNFEDDNIYHILNRFEFQF